VSVYAIEEKNGEFADWSRRRDTLTLVPQSETEFFDRPFWSTIVFAKDSQGKVTHLIWRYGGQDYRAEKLP